MPAEQTTRARELSPGKGTGLVFAVALLATALMAAPVILAPSERIFGSGEILSHEDPSRDALVVIDQFRTGHVPLPYLQPLTDLPGRALAPVIGPVVAYNLLVLLSFPLAASTAYLLSLHLKASHLAAMVAGLAYAFAPFHVLQAGGHPHIAQAQWLPLYFLALWRCIDRPDPRRALLLLIAAAAVATADFYAGFVAAVLSPVSLVAYGLGSAQPAIGTRGRRMGVTALVLIVAAILGLGAIRTFVPEVATQPETQAVARPELFEWSARWWSYLVPPADHPIWGSAVKEFWNRRGVGLSLLEHQQVSLSLSLGLLSLIPLWRWLRRDRNEASSPIAPALAIVAGAALLCSLSPERTVLSFRFVRPSALLYEVAPMFRAYARFGGVVCLMAALLAGQGAAMLWRESRWRRLAATGLVLFAIVEFATFPPWRSRDLLPTAAHRFLRSQPGPMRILDCVKGTRMSDTLAAPLLGHPISLLGEPGLDDCGEPRLGEKLSALGYTHVILRRDTPAGSWFAPDQARSGMTPGPGFKDAWIFTTKAEPPVVYLEAWSGFYPREYDASRTWRWMTNVGAMRFVAARAQTDASVDIELRSFPANRRVAWSVNGQKLGELEVTPDWRHYELRLGPLGQGKVDLAFASAEPAVVAQSVLHNDDPRAVGLAVSTWTLKDAGR